MAGTRKALLWLICTILLTIAIQVFNNWQVKRPSIDYTSSSSFLGLPIVQIKLPNTTRTNELKKMSVNDALAENHATGWIAIGGLAVGGIAIGGISFGVCAFGVCSVSVFGAGVVCITLVRSFGVISIAGYRANGVISVAFDRAVGVHELDHHGARTKNAVQNS